MSNAEDFFSFEIIDDPEMTEIGQRLIEQGAELLDVTDMNADEKKQAEKIFSEAWDDLHRAKIVKDAYLHMACGKSQPKLTEDGKRVSNLGDLLKNFLAESIHVLDRLSRLAKLCTRGNVSIRSYLKDCPQAFDLCADTLDRRAQDIKKALQNAESGWLREFRTLHRQIHEEKNICLLFQSQNGNLGGLKFLDGRLVEKSILDLWSGLTNFCEDYLVYLLQLRFLDFVSDLEVIAKDSQDIVYPRKFRVRIQGESSGSGERPE